jgi:hypothetical protein
VADALFPFGQVSTPRPPRRPSPGGVAEAFVLGVYPSAFHVRWRPPSWLSARVRSVSALAVDDEPTVFWDGSGAAAEFARWVAAVGFEAGDDVGQWGEVRPFGNGTSGRSVVERVLEPLGVDPSATWFTDAVDRFFVKGRGPGGWGQASVHEWVYNPFAVTVGGRLLPASLPARPAPAELVRVATADHAGRLRRELLEARAETVITLGEEARQVLLTIADSSVGESAAVLTRPRFQGPSFADYGEAGIVRIGDHTARWYALVHPGQRSLPWRRLHDRWMERREAER